MNNTQHYDYIIIGGGVAGTTAAETIRRQNPNVSIALFEAEDEFLYSRVMLPHFIRGKQNRDSVFLRNRDNYIEQRIEFFRGKVATAIHPEKKEISFGEKEHVHYDKLLVAMGGRPREWNVGYPESMPIFRMQTLSDADSIKKFINIESSVPRSVAVIGGGFIGLEFVESFVAAGIHVDLFLRGERCFGGRVSEKFLGVMKQIHRGRNITVHRSTEVTSVKEKGGGIFELTTTKGVVDTHGAALGIGIVRNLDLVEEAGLAVDRGVKTNQYLQTANPDIFAAGDVAQYVRQGNTLDGLSGTWSGAAIQGTMVGGNILGQKEAFGKVPAYTILHFGMHIGFVGESYCKEMEVVVRDDGTHNPYAEFYFQNGILRGATVVGMPKAIGILLRWIQEKKITLAAREQLESPAIDLKEIENE